MASDDPPSREPAPRATCDAAFPRVADAITLCLWRQPTLQLARWAGRSGLAGHFMTLAGATLAALTFWLFWSGRQWPGLLSGFAFVVVGVAGRMHARGAGGRSRRADVLDAAFDLVAPPLWWWAWEHGLAAYGRPLEPVTATMVLWAIIGGHAAERLIERLFIRRFGGTPIDRWTKLDSRFRLVGAGTNVNLAILATALLLRRPDSGLVLVAWWTIVSAFFHALRYAQASEHVARGEPITCWLDA